MYGELSELQFELRGGEKIIKEALFSKHGLPFGCLFPFNNFGSDGCIAACVVPYIEFLSLAQKTTGGFLTSQTVKTYIDQLNRIFRFDVTMSAEFMELYRYERSERSGDADAAVDSNSKRRKVTNVPSLMLNSAIVSAIDGVRMYSLLREILSVVDPRFVLSYIC